MKTKRLLLVALPFLDSALMLTLIQPPIGWSFFAWVAVISFVLGCSPLIRPRTVALSAYAAGAVYWLVNLYWIAPITIPGWIALCLYMALLWPLLALALRFCRARNIPLTLAVPVLIVGAERLQGFPMGGFYWRLLGHSQYANLTLIQIADIFGAGGVSFLVAMVNGFVLDAVLAIGACRLGPALSEEGNEEQMPLAREIREWFFLERKPAGIWVIVQAALVVAAVVATVLYGRWRLAQAGEYVVDGPRVAALQSNVPQSVKIGHMASDELFAELMVQSQAAAAAGAELIAWPETMVQGILQPEIWPFLRDPAKQDKAFHDALAEHAKDTAYLLVGAYGGEILTDAKGKPYLGDYNSAFFYRSDGTRDPNRYNKIHLVLFGEYIPFRRSFNWLYQQLRRFAPYDYDYSLEHGTEYTIFEMTTPIRATEPNDADNPAEPNRPEVTYRFGTIICYEDAIPYVGRNFALDENGRKRVDWLVNISNDGWFVRFLEDPPRVVPSSELP
ncbi:MAG: apolipoprotein N-acyltransferase, partial [Planctomycetota bacterium]